MIKELRNAIEGDAPAKEQTRAETLQAQATGYWGTPG
jgi:2-hydroxychromene-2-carboxylate isomerase